MANNRDSSMSFFCGMLVGSLVGASVAIMLAPDSGANTRTALRGRASECKDKLSVLAGEYKERFARITDEYREKLKELSVEMREHRLASSGIIEGDDLIDIDINENDINEELVDSEFHEDKEEEA